MKIALIPFWNIWVTMANKDTKPNFITWMLYYLSVTVLIPRMQPNSAFGPIRFWKIICSKDIIYTAQISKQLTLDLQRHNAQYAPVIIKQFKQSHDRFLLIDDKDIYHIGASLKDLGKKWFAFSKLNLDIKDIIQKII